MNTNNEPNETNKGTFLGMSPIEWFGATFIVGALIWVILH
jgi:hypothetical protein